jgi:hypothetical protein
MTWLGVDLLVLAVLTAPVPPEAQPAAKVPGEQVLPALDSAITPAS